MRVLVEYRDGSQKILLDDGREVIISAPYRDGSRKIDGDDGSSGWLTDKYNDGSRQATMDDGTVYSVDERNTYFSGKQEVWEKIKDGGRNSSTSSGGSGGGGGDLVGFFIGLIAPFTLLPVIFITQVLAWLGIGFGLPLAVFAFLFYFITKFAGIGLGTFFNAALSMMSCVLIMFTMKYFYQKMRWGWKKFFTLTYLILLLAIPWTAMVYAYANGKETLLTPLSTVLKVGDPWNLKNVSLRLQNVDIDANSIKLHFYVTNKTDYNIVSKMERGHEYFQLIDNNGKHYPQPPLTSTWGTFYPDNTSRDIGPRFELNPEPSDPPVKYFLFIVNGICGVQNATWKIEVPR